MRLEGKVAIITGGARGQGAAEARLFAREAAKVVIGDVLDEQGAKVADEIVKSGGDALYVHLDVSKEEDWRLAIETTVSKYGKLNVLVNNAAIFAARSGRGDHVGALGCGAGCQCQGGISWHQAGDTRDEEGGRRLYRQHLFFGGPGGRHSQCSLQRIKGGGPPIHQGYSCPVR